MGDGLFVNINILSASLYFQQLISGEQPSEKAKEERREKRVKVTERRRDGDGEAEGEAGKLG